MTIQTALAFTLPQEGGYVDNPDDHGGPTNHGITQAVYDRYLNANGELNQSVQLISDAEIQDIYSSTYWTPAHCDELSEKVGVCHFDWAVNHGVTGAIRTLQSVVGVAEDGLFGPHTLAAVQAMDESELITAYLNARLAWYEDFAQRDPSQAQFLDGWVNRVHDLTSYLGTL